MINEKIEELKKEILKLKQAVWDRGITEKELSEYDEQDGYSRERYWDGDIMVLEVELQTLQEAQEEFKKMILFYKRTWEEDKNAMFNEGYMENLFDNLLLKSQSGGKGEK